MWIALWTLGCGSSGPPSEGELLAAADAHDGAADHVVHECAGCALGMPGAPEHVVKHAGYELHFCSESCKRGFEADPAGGLAKLAPALGR